MRRVSYVSNKVSHDFVESILESGFVVLTQHPIKKSLVKNVYEQWKLFFASSEKYKYKRNKETGDGYVPMEIEHAKTRYIPDIKEFFHYYKWGLQPEYIDLSSTEELYDELTKLGVEFLEWIESLSPISVRQKFSIPLPEMVKESDQHLFRPLHYPPLNGNEHESAERSAPHEDINLLTILFAGGTSRGLELLDKNEKWYAVPSNPGELIINSADMLQMASDYYYKSTTHRVKNPQADSENISRYALAYFVHPSPEVKLSENHTARSYLNKRLEEIGLS